MVRGVLDDGYGARGLELSDPADEHSILRSDSELSMARALFPHCFFFCVATYQNLDASTCVCRHHVFWRRARLHVQRCLPLRLLPLAISLILRAYGQLNLAC